MAVETVLKRQKGVVEAGVNFAADTAVVRWSPAITSFEILKDAIAKLGYRVDEIGADIQSTGRVTSLKRDLVLRLAVGVVFGMWSMLAALVLYFVPGDALSENHAWMIAIASGAFAIPVLTYSGYRFYVAGWRTLRAGVPGLDSLITLAVTASIILSLRNIVGGNAHVYFDAAVMLVLFQLIARLVDHSVRRDAANAVQSFLKDLPGKASVVASEDQVLETDVAILRPGDRIRLTPSQRVPVDGKIVAGSAEVDTSLITGESESHCIESGDSVFAGTILHDGEVTLEVVAGVGKRRVDAIANGVRRLLSHKSALQRLTDRIARLLLPIIIAASISSFFVGLMGTDHSVALERALAVLIISCPCALSLAIPLIAVLSTRLAFRQSILIQDPAALERAGEIQTVILDKTGTLTDGELRIHAVSPQPGVLPEDLLRIAANATSGDRHPVAMSLNRAASTPMMSPAESRRSVPGRGVEWKAGRDVIMVGNYSWLAASGIPLPPRVDKGTSVHVASNGHYLGSIGFDENLREDVAAVVKALLSSGLRVVMLSGDSQTACGRVAGELELSPTDVFPEHDPEQKQRVVEEIESTGPTLYAGDGMNDGLALAAASLGVAVDRATPTANAAAAILLPNGISNLPAALELSRRSRWAMRQNLLWALAYNAVALPLAVSGLVVPAVAALAMSLSTVCVLGNSMWFQYRVARSWNSAQREA